MRNCSQIDLIVSDVPKAAAFFRDIVGLALRVNEPRFAELDGKSITLMLSPEALVPVQPAAGIIIHVEVDDVTQALKQAQSAGATVLLELTTTDWGTESAMIAGPEDIVIDFYRWTTPQNHE